MAITIDGTTGITTPGLVNTGTESVVGLTTTGNTILGDASTDTLNVGNGGLVKDASGNVGIGTSSPSVNLNVYKSSDGIVARFQRSSGGGLVDIETYNGIGGIGTADNIPFRLNTNNTERMRINSSGNIGVNTGANIYNTFHVNGGISVQSGPMYATSGAGLELWYNTALGVGVVAAYDRTNSVYKKLDISGTVVTATTEGVERLRIDSAGALILAGSTAQKATGTTWSNPSDIRLKDNITEYAKGIDELMQVSVKEWEYNGKGGTTEGLKGLGVIADEVMLILPNTVENYKAKLNTDDEEDSDIKKFDATEITWLMLKSIQELKAIIDTQNDTINNLTTRLETLEGAV